MKSQLSNKPYNSLCMFCNLPKASLALFQLFDMLKNTHGPGILSRVEAINGDVTLPGLGISTEDRKKLCEEVEIVYHAAATIRFDEPLRKAVLLNTRGTKFMLELAQEMEKLLVSKQFRPNLLLLLLIFILKMGNFYRCDEHWIK